MADTDLGVVLPGVALTDAATCARLIVRSYGFRFVFLFLCGINNDGTPEDASLEIDAADFREGGGVILTIKAERSPTLDEDAIVIDVNNRGANETGS